MNCPNCNEPFCESHQTYECGSFVANNGEFAKTQMCKKIAYLREMLLEALPVVQDAVSDLTYKHEGQAKIAGLAKRIENEVNT